MNVIKNEFFSKQKRLRCRTRKHFKSNLPGYHTVTNTLSSPFHSIILSERNHAAAILDNHEATDLQSTSKSISDFYYEECTSTEKISNISSRKRKRQDDEIEEISKDSTSPVSSISDISAAKFSTIMKSFYDVKKLTFSENEAFQNYRISLPENYFDGRRELNKLGAKKSQNVFLRTIESSQSNCEDSFNSFENIINRSSNAFCRAAQTTENEIVVQMIKKEKFTLAKMHRIIYKRIPFKDLRNNSNLLETTLGSTKIPLRKKSAPSTTKPSDVKTPVHKIKKSPKISGSKSGTTSDCDAGSYILAVTEGRGQARGEVGIAAMDPQRPHLILCQISDNQRYVHSLTKMNVLKFVEIIIPNTFIEGSSPSKLYMDIRKHFPTTTITSLQRRHFNEKTGLELINQYSSPESGTVMILIRDKFYALSAASALIKYIEYAQNVIFASRSVKVEYQGTEDTMIIDLDTANRLELVVSLINAESSFNNTLLGVLKHCNTKGGMRLLRANILQPPCSLIKIETRLDCVTELIQKPLFFFALEAAVSGFANTENLLSLCMHAPKQDGLRVAEFQLKYVLLLKTTLEMLPTLIAALEEGSSEYFCAVRENLGDARYRIILDRILETIFESAKTVKGSVAAHLHGCFAIKTGINGLLDIAKKTYCEIVQEIWDHISSLREKYGLPLRMSFSAQRGFHIQCSSFGEKNVEINKLPKQFILIQKTKSTFSFYTSELVALDQRSQQVLNEIKLMTNVILYEMLSDIRQYIGCLLNLCEYIAELDVIISFAHVSSGKKYVRPCFGEKLDICESRHPILDVIHDALIVPNDIYAEQDQNFIILTGPNQSGKSIYIGQVALLQIMAQIGCYVPAKVATFRITDRIFSRIGFDDSIENNASTLMVEMRDIEYLRHNITDKSLVVIDELCRGTSVNEGTSLAFAICEEFLDSKAFIFMTTHYIFLTKLEEMYFNVRNNTKTSEYLNNFQLLVTTLNGYHFESKLVQSVQGKFSLQFTHKRLSGVTKAEEYGLKVAELTSFPNDVLAKAKEIAQVLSLERKPVLITKGLSARYKICQELKKELSLFDSESSWNDIVPIVLHFKELMLKLGPFDDHNLSEISSMQKKEERIISSQEIVHVSLPEPEQRGLIKENNGNEDNVEDIIHCMSISRIGAEPKTTSTENNKVKSSTKFIETTCARNMINNLDDKNLNDLRLKESVRRVMINENFENQFIRMKNPILEIAKKIKRKYRNLIINKAYYTFLREEHIIKSNVVIKPFLINFTQSNVEGNSSERQKSKKFFLF